MLKSAFHRNIKVNKIGTINHENWKYFIYAIVADGAFSFSYSSFTKLRSVRAFSVLHFNKRNWILNVNLTVHLLRRSVFIRPSWFILKAHKNEIAIIDQSAWKLSMLILMSELLLWVHLHFKWRAFVLCAMCNTSKSVVRSQKKTPWVQKLDGKRENIMSGQSIFVQSFLVIMRSHKSSGSDFIQALHDTHDEH